MPHDVYLEINTLIDGRSISFRCECWIDADNAEGIIMVEGRSLEDQDRLMKHRAQIAAQMVADQGLEHVRIFEGGRNGRYTELQLGTDADGRIVSATKTRTTLTRRELAGQGSQLLDREVRARRSISPYLPSGTGRDAGLSAWTDLR